MRFLKKIIPIVITAFLLGSNYLIAQRGGGRGHGYGNAYGHRRVGGPAVIIKPSPFRPAKIVVYHPVWGPNYYIQRRWVYFPKYNIYWDNWRNCYVFWNGSIWFSQSAAPPVIVNVNLQNEKHYELKENEDDTDDVYKGNDVHKSEYKAE